MTVRELIEELKEFNQDAIVYIGDNIDNQLEITWGGSDGCTEATCEDVGFHTRGNQDVENLPSEWMSDSENNLDKLYEHDVN